MILSKGNAKGPAFSGQVALMKAVVEGWNSADWGVEGYLLDRFLRNRRNWPTIFIVISVTWRLR